MRRAIVLFLAATCAATGVKRKADSHSDGPLPKKNGSQEQGSTPSHLVTPALHKIVASSAKKRIMSDISLPSVDPVEVAEADVLSHNAVNVHGNGSGPTVEQPPPFDGGDNPVTGNGGGQPKNDTYHLSLSLPAFEAPRLLERPPRGASTEENKAFYAQSMAIAEATKYAKKAVAKNMAEVEQILEPKRKERARAELDLAERRLREIYEKFIQLGICHFKVAYSLELRAALEKLEVNGDDKPLLRHRREMRIPGTESVLDNAIYCGRRHYEISQNLNE